MSLGGGVEGRLVRRFGIAEITGRVRFWARNGLRSSASKALSAIRSLDAEIAASSGPRAGDIGGLPRGQQGGRDATQLVCDRLDLGRGNNAGRRV